MVPRSACALAALLSCCCLAVPVPALAGTRADIFENVGTFSLADRDPSTRSAGMGGASGAVFWGAEANAWANPALLGFASGVRYTDDVTTLLPDGNLRYVAHQATVGYGGIGVSFAGQPFDGLGKREVADDLTVTTAYGSSMTTSFYERVRSWSAGASVAGVLTHWAQLRRREAPAFVRHADVAFGYGEEVLESGLTTSPPLAPPIRERGVSHDAGLLARAGGALARGGGEAMPLRLDAAYGLSALGGSHDRMGGSPLDRHLRNAFAARAALGPPERWSRALPPWAAPALETFLSLGLAYDAEHVTSGSFRYDLHHYGAELGITSVLSIDLGHFESATQPGTHTWGYAVTLPIGRVGGARYAYARVPKQAWLDMPDTPHRSWSVWLDPLALASARH